MDHFRYFLFILSLLIISCSDSDENGDPNSGNEPKGEFIDEWTYKVNPGVSDNFIIANFRVWVPEDIDDLRAILVLANSYNSNGIGLVLLEEWQEYAKKEKLALLSLYLKSGSGSRFYGEAGDGSGDAMLFAISKIAQKHNLNDLNSLPILARGFSAGGIFSYHLAGFLPERVVAFANIRGGNFNTTSSATSNIPGIMLLGENDLEFRNNNIIDIVNSKRKDDGEWCYVIEPKVDHYGNLSNSDVLIRHFFSIALEKRLKNDESNGLKIISESSGWLGDNDTKNYFSYENYPNAKVESSWLIDEDFARHWRNFQLN